MIKRIVFVFLTLALILVSVLILGEIGTRLYYIFADRQRPLFVPDPILGELRPRNSSITYVYDEEEKRKLVFRTNSLGLVGPEVKFHKPVNTFRILVLGDSFTESVQVPEDKNFRALLQDHITNAVKTKKTIEIINGGIIGYSPIRLYFLYKHQLAKFNSDLVILQLFANDVYEDNKWTATSVLDKDGLPIRLKGYFTKDQSLDDSTPISQKNDTLRSLREFFLQKSRLVEAVYCSLYRQQKKTAYNKQMMADDQYQMGHLFFILYQGGGNHQLEDPAFRQKVSLQTERYIKAIRDEAARNGAKFMMLYIPVEAQLKRDAYSEHIRVFTAQQYSQYFNNRLTKLSQVENMNFLDLTPAFQAHEKENLFMNKDGHLTERGQRLVADTLFEYLASSDLLSAGMNSQR